MRSCVCFRCGKNIYRRCAKENQPRQISGSKQVDLVEEQQAAEDDFTIWTITGDHKEGYHVRLQINGKHTQIELDTGAAVSVISEQGWNQLFTSTPLEQYAHYEGIQVSNWK